MLIVSGVFHRTSLGADSYGGSGGGGGREFSSGMNVFNVNISLV